MASSLSLLKGSTALEGTESVLCKALLFLLSYFYYEVQQERREEAIMARFVNLTPHAIVLNGGESIPPSGNVARVSVNFSEFDANGIASTEYGSVEGLPPPETGIFLIVSALVLAACNDRTDLVAPATGHPQAKRNDKGQIVSVPGFVRN